MGNRVGGERRTEGESKSAANTAQDRAIVRNE
jgi:hypothetical protein